MAVIFFISAALPPALDGIGDYTARLGAELSPIGHHVTVLTGQPAPEPIAGVTVQTVFSAADPGSVRGLLAPIEAARPDWVVLQYNPFSYGRWGLNMYLPAVVAAIKRRYPKTELALMTHEFFAEPVHTWQFAAMNLWQRPQFWALGQLSDLIFFSMAASTRRFERWFPQTPCHLLPVGSNLPQVLICRTEARARLGIGPKTLVLGLFGTAHISRQMGLVREAALVASEGGREVCVLSVGPNQNAVCQALADLPPQIRVIADGPASASEASRRFAAMDIALLPFSDGISTRRGTLMAALQHGVASVGTRGVHTDAHLQDANGTAFLLADCHASAQFADAVRRLSGDEALRQTLGRNAQQFYTENYAWPRLAGKMLAVLGECP